MTKTETKRGERCAFNACDHVRQWYWLQYQAQRSSFYREDALAYAEAGGAPHYVPEVTQ